MKRIYSRAIITGIFLLIHGAVGALEEPGQGTLNEIYRAIVDSLPESDKRVFNNVPLIVVDDKFNFFVGVFHSPTSTPSLKIAYSAKAHEILSGVASAIGYSAAYSTPNEFLFGYMRYLAHSNLYAGKAMTPLEFDRAYGNERVSQFDETKWHDYIDSIPRIYSAVHVFVIAHEMGHILNEHQRSVSKSLYDSRLQESEADRWALQTVLAMGLSPSYTLPYLMFHELGGRTARHQELSTHPAPLERARDLLRLEGQHYQQFSAHEPHAGAVRKTQLFLPRIEEMIIERDLRDGSVGDIAKAAYEGDRFFQSLLGHIYAEGSRGAKKNNDLAIEWLVKASKDRPGKYDYLDETQAHMEVALFYMALGLPTMASKFLETPLLRNYLPALVLIEEIRALNQ